MGTAIVLMIVALSLVIWIVRGVYKLIQEDKRGYAAPENYTETKRIYDLISFDDNANKWYAVERGNAKDYKAVYSFDDIAKYELLKDGIVTPIKGGLGSAVVGGLLFGGAGAVAGATIGKSGGETIKDIQVKITLRDINSQPVYIKALGFKDKTELQVAHDIIAAFDVRIGNKIDNTDNKIDSTDELRKYKQLLDDGVITQKDFDAKKRQILGL